MGTPARVRRSKAHILLTAGQLEYFAAAFRTRRGDIGRNRSCEMFNVTTSLASPRQRSFFLITVEQLQRVLRLMTYGLQDLPESF